MDENKVKEIEERFIQLETKFAFQEDFVSQLQGVVVEQAKIIEKLEREIKCLQKKFVILIVRKKFQIVSHHIINTI